MARVLTETVLSHFRKFLYMFYWDETILENAVSVDVHCFLHAAALYKTEVGILDQEKFAVIEL